MKSHITLGATPCNEECEQVGPNYSPERARQECQQFISAIRRTCGKEPEGAKLTVKSFAHDFGSYMEVIVWFDDTDCVAVNYAYTVESNSPSDWTDADRKALELTCVERTERTA